MATQHIICSETMIGHTWYNYMVQLHGTTTWYNYMVQLHGTITWYNYKPPANIIAGGLTLSLNKVTAIRPEMYIAVLSNTVSSFWM